MNGNNPVVPGNGQKNPFDLTNVGNYEHDYEMPWSDKIEKLYEVPPIKDMAGVVIRGIFKNERTLNAILRLSYRHVKLINIRNY
jgi:ribose 5-phosphate isomerase